MSKFVEAVLLVALAQVVSSSIPTISAPWGTIQGVSLEGDGKRKMNGYLGIPYALPPVGDLRFEKPQPHPGPGEGKVFVADQIMPPCPQLPMLIGTERATSEDCLMLDVYTPVDADKAVDPLSVMVFIHGGGFTGGDAFFYRPSKIVVDGNVIVVAIQYRLGTLGFLSTGDGLVKGNMGLIDQNLAIRWVKENIKAFGGDPNSITLFGESAGSMSVGLQMFSPMSRGLFQRAILQSGSPTFLSKMTSLFDYKSVFKGLADAFECKGETNLELLQCLKQTPTDEFFNKSAAYAATSPMTTYFFPVVDSEFIPRDPIELVQDEEYMQENGIKDTDVILSFNNKEGAQILVMMDVLNMTAEGLQSAEFFGTMQNTCLQFSNFTRNPVLEKNIEFFYRGADFGTSNPVPLDAVSDMYGDCLMTAPVLEWARYLAASSHSAGLYLYVMEHDFECNKNGPIPGSHHGDELLLQFDGEREFPKGSIIIMLNKTVIAESEKPLAAKFNQMFASFAKTGNPNPPIRNDLGGDWPKFTTENNAYLSVSNSMHVENDGGPYKERAALWLKLLPELQTLTSQLKDNTKEEQAQGKDEL